MSLRTAHWIAFAFAVVILSMILQRSGLTGVILANVYGIALGLLVELSRERERVA